MVFITSNHLGTEKMQFVKCEKMYNFGIKMKITLPLEYVETLAVSMASRDDKVFILV